MSFLDDPLRAVDRWLYRGGRPDPIARTLNSLWRQLAERGIGPSRLSGLDVAGRTSGRTISTPVVVADWEGERYLVSMLGEGSNWVKNVRAAGGEAVLRRGGAEPVLLREVPVAERAPVIRRYVAVAPGGRSHIQLNPDAPLAEFEAAAPRLPVFRVEPRPDPSQQERIGTT